MFPFSQLIGIHGKTHGTTRFTPLQACLGKYFIQSFQFGLGFNQPGTRNYKGFLDIGRNLAPFYHRCRSAQVFNTGIGTGANKNPIQLDRLNWNSSLQPHVFKRLLVVIAFTFIAH